jgi:NTP pyrophosphatase (non-canonical NTP hydrolase)
VSDLTFRTVSETNRKRCERWHPGFPGDAWTGADWSNAMCGEAGETANIVKKLRRHELGTGRDTTPPVADLRAKLAMEIGDVYLYLDLLAQHYGLDIAECVAATFNRVSVREGFPDRLPMPPKQATLEAGAST